MILFVLILPMLYLVNFLYIQYNIMEKIFIAIILNILLMLILLYSLSGLGIFKQKWFLVSYFFIVFCLNGSVFIKYRKKSKKMNIIELYKVNSNKTSLLLLIIISFGFFLRIYDSITRKDFSNGDVYTHYKMTVEALKGNTYTVFGSYNRGFHLIVIAIHWITGGSIYEIIRYIGPVLSSLSILAVYLLIKKILGKAPALYATLFYGCATFGNTLLRRQTISLSEAPVFFLIPISLLFLFYLKSNIEKRKMEFKNILGFSIPTFLIALIHPISAMYFQYILMIFLLLIILKYALNKISIKSSLNFKFSKKSILTTLILIIFVMPVTVYSYADMSKKMTDTSYKFEIETKDSSNKISTTNSDILGESSSSVNLFNDIFSFNEQHDLKSDVSSFQYITFIFILIIAIFTFFYFFKSDFFIVFFALSTLFLGFILLTGFGEPSMYSLRSSVYFIFLGLIFGGILLEKVLWKLFNFSKKLKVFNNLDNLTYKKWSHFFLIFILIFFMITIPFFKIGYSHTGYEDNIDATLKINNEYSMNDVILYSGKFGGGREGNIIIGNSGIYSDLRELVHYSPRNLTHNSINNKTIFIEKNYAFIFLEKKPYPLRTSDFEEVAYNDQNNNLVKVINNRENITKEVEIWVDEYIRYHEHIDIYYESDKIIVYLIEKNLR